MGVFLNGRPHHFLIRIEIEHKWNLETINWDIQLVLLNGIQRGLKYLTLYPYGVTWLVSINDLSPIKDNSIREMSSWNFGFFGTTREMEWIDVYFEFCLWGNDIGTHWNLCALRCSSVETTESSPLGIRSKRHDLVAWCNPMIAMNMVPETKWFLFRYVFVCDDRE